jgi:hypothetical protein
LGQADDADAKSEVSTLSVLLYKAPTLQGGEESAHCGLVQVKGVGEVGHGGGAVGLGEADE